MKKIKIEIIITEQDDTNRFQKTISNQIATELLSKLTNEISSASVDTSQIFLDFNIEMK